jgi:hypothetical protein
MRHVTLFLLAALLPAQTTNREPPARLIVLQLTSLGLQPESLLLEPGRYIIRLRNGLFTRAVQLRVEDERSTSLRSVTAAAGAGRADLDFSFALGKHAIVVDGNSKLRTVITVTADPRPLPTPVSTTAPAQ